RTVGDLIKAAKANPGKLNYASGGNGSPQHLSMALLASRANITMTHVPYKGATPAAVAAGAGEVDVTFQGLGTVTSLLQAGKLRLLAVSSAKRLPQYPNVPTIAESGELPDFYFNSWFALVAPAKTSKEVVNQLYTEVKAAMDDPETRAKIVAGGATPRAMPPAEFGKAIADQYKMYRKLIDDNNIKAE
ncbi:MAG: tripartite tricarboxylate transporter substrate binding protein, partial [Haliea sp.]